MTIPRSRGKAIFLNFISSQLLPGGSKGKLLFLGDYNCGYIFDLFPNIRSLDFDPEF